MGSTNKDSSNPESFYNYSQESFNTQIEKSFGKNEFTPTRLFLNKLGSILLSIIRNLCSFRIIFPVFFSLGMTCITFLMVGLSVFLATITINSTASESLLLISRFLNEEITAWLGQGKKTVDFQLSYLKDHENDIQDLDFKEFDSDTIEISKMLYFF